MLVARYRHRLPADYAMARIRARIAERAAAWDAMPGLVFKVFAIEDRAHGAAANAYGSLYLWRDPAAAADFLAGPGFRSVVESFGRPRIETWLAFDAALGAAGTARVVCEDARLVGPAAELGDLRESERARSRELAGQEGVLATIVGLDTAAWRLTRFTLRADPAAADSVAEIAHLASPGLATAPGLRSPIPVSGVSRCP